MNSLIDKILDTVHTMYFKHKQDFLGEVSMVMIVTPKTYYELRAEANENITYLNTDIIHNIHFLNVAGLKLPVVIQDDLPDNVLFQIMYEEDFTRLEKEKLYERLNKMFY